MLISSGPISGAPISGKFEDNFPTLGVLGVGCWEAFDAYIPGLVEYDAYIPGLVEYQEFVPGFEAGQGEC